MVNQVYLATKVVELVFRSGNTTRESTLFLERWMHLDVVILLVCRTCMWEQRNYCRKGLSSQVQKYESFSGLIVAPSGLPPGGSKKMFPKTARTGDIRLNI